MTHRTIWSRLKHSWEVRSQSVCEVHSSRAGRVWSACARVWHFFVVGQHANALGTLANAPFAKESPVWHAVFCLVAPRPCTTPLTNGPRTRDRSCLYRCPEEKGGQPFFVPLIGSPPRQRLEHARQAGTPYQGATWPSSPIFGREGK